MIVENMASGGLFYTFMPKLFAKLKHVFQKDWAIVDSLKTYNLSAYKLDESRLSTYIYIYCNCALKIIL